jgi:hypothetical protein
MTRLPPVVSEDPTAGSPSGGRSGRGGAAVVGGRTSGVESIEAAPEPAGVTAGAVLRNTVARLPVALAPPAVAGSVPGPAGGWDRSG